MRPFSIGHARRSEPAGRVDKSPGAGVTSELDQCLRLVGRGDQEAFARFYDLSSGLVHGIVLQVVRSPALAEEVTQEVFVELWRLAPRFDASRGTPKAWIATVAHRRAVDRVRSEQAARNRDDRDGRRQANAGTAAGDRVGDEVVDRMDRERVGAALQELATPQREALTMAYYGGHTYRRIAELLDVPEGTIKTRIRDGLIRLRGLLEVTP